MRGGGGGWGRGCSSVLSCRVGCVSESSSCQRLVLRRRSLGDAWPGAVGYLDMAMQSLLLSSLFIYLLG